MTDGPVSDWRNPDVYSRFPVPLMARHPLTKARIAAVWRRNVAPDDLLLLAKDPEGEVRMEVARLCRAPVEVLPWLASDPLVEVRMSVATDPRIDDDTAMRLASDSSAAVRVRLLRNRAAPVEAFERCVADPDENIRLDALMWSPHAPGHVVAALADTGDICEWEALAHPNMPSDVAARIVRDRGVSYYRQYVINPNSDPEFLIEAAAELNVPKWRRLMGQCRWWAGLVRGFTERAQQGFPLPAAATAGVWPHVTDPMQRRELIAVTADHSELLTSVPSSARELADYSNDTTVLQQLAQHPNPDIADTAARRWVEALANATA